jgi:hypothetical protein
MLHFNCVNLVDLAVHHHLGQDASFAVTSSVGGSVSQRNSKHLAEFRRIPLASLDFRRFGATMDGVTDDTSSIQEAINDYARHHSSAGTNSLKEPQRAHLTIIEPPSDSM